MAMLAELEMDPRRLLSSSGMRLLTAATVTIGFALSHATPAVADSPAVDVAVTVGDPGSNGQFPIGVDNEGECVDFDLNLEETVSTPNGTSTSSSNIVINNLQSGGQPPHISIGGSNIEGANATINLYDCNDGTTPLASPYSFIFEPGTYVIQSPVTQPAPPQPPVTGSPPGTGGEGSGGGSTTTGSSSGATGESGSMGSGGSGTTGTSSVGEGSSPSSTSTTPGEQDCTVPKIGKDGETLRQVVVSLVHGTCQLDRLDLHTPRLTSHQKRKHLGWRVVGFELENPQQDSNHVTFQREPAGVQLPSGSELRPIERLIKV
jgi:hypothetical protein